MRKTQPSVTCIVNECQVTQVLLQSLNVLCFISLLNLQSQECLIPLSHVSMQTITMCIQRQPQTCLALHSYCTTTSSKRGSSTPHIRILMKMLTYSPDCFHKRTSCPSVCYCLILQNKLLQSSQGQKPRCEPPLFSPRAC